MSAPIDDARLAEMQARCDAATPGPWTSPRGFPFTEANSVFVVAARTDVPDLIAEVRRLRTILHRVLDMRAKMR